MNVQPVFQGEVMLAGWSETHNGGVRVTFWLQDADDLRAFKAMTVAKGKIAGQRLALVAVEIGDDEQPVQRDGKPKGGDLSKLAGQFCKNPDFRKFFGFADEDEAADAIRRGCGIESRAELDHNEKAAAIFHDRYRKPFVAWKEGAA